MAIFNRATPRTIHDHHHAEIIDVGLPSHTIGGSTIAQLYIGAWLLTFASVSQNILFASAITQTLVANVVTGALLIGFNLLEIAFPTLIRHAWNGDRHLYCVFITIGFVCAVVVSIVAGTAYQASTVEGAQNERVQGSQQYQALTTNIERLQAEASSIAIAPEQVAQAQTALARLNSQRDQVIRSNSLYMTADLHPKGLWGKKTKKIIAEEITPIDELIYEQQKVLDANSAYHAKLAEINRMQLSVPNVSAGAGELAGFTTLGNWLDVPAEQVRVAVLTYSNLFMAFLAALAWYGYTVYTERKTLSYPDMMLAKRQWAAQEELAAKVELAVAEKMASIHSISRDKEPSNTTDKSTGEKEVGQVCQCEDCGENYTVKHVNHVVCKDCRKSRNCASAAASRAAKKAAAE